LRNIPPEPESWIPPTFLLSQHWPVQRSAALTISTLVSAYALISRMRVLSSPPVLQKAEAVIRTRIETYFSPNKTPFELRTLLDNDAIDPLRAFSEECRVELETLKGFGDPPQRTLIGEADRHALSD
jgi:hypothetical protein